MPAFSRFLRYFIAVAQHQSIRKASESLRISASAIDRQILQGEQTLGTPLFERLPTGLRLTTAGEMLLDQAKRWSKELDSYLIQIDDLKGLRRGSVNIMIPNAMTRGFMPKLIRNLRISHPGIVVNIFVRNSKDIGPALARGEADLAILFDPGNVRDLIVRSYIEFPLGFITPPEHPLADKKHARFSACMEYDIIAPALPLALRRKIDVLEIETGITMNEVLSSDSIDMIKSMISKNYGISIMSYADVMEEVEENKISFTHISNEKLTPLTAALCVDRSRTLSSAARLLLQKIEVHFLELHESMQKLMRDV
ncbi:LysR family transcriptional regulator [Neokomagataea thailandica NBRC 106555]|uniref:LysR family transcriptional regulator n=2 Tax=Neokomagataea TaxID=1223423 RepID=A0A4Y6VAQ3_9PROT|nr:MULTISPECIES: LysR family transcriptional regulator [Neokomagataea]QDH25445.1 LysR family transcriptional regulator [Neokomagataea tanensis]GBR50730.1 LysR family transcriptional regulator [Neokomagataea thailandica NBRC 106555]